VSGARLVDDARAVLGAMDDPRREDFLAFLDSHARPLDRSCEAGHITASALLVDPRAGRALLMLHRKVGRWLQMGGHCETGDLTLRAAAAREATEESGIGGLVLTDAPVALDRHRVRCDGRDLDHLDVQFIALTPAGAVEQANDESLGLRWFDLDDVPSEDAAVLRLAAAARSLVA